MQTEREIWTQSLVILLAFGIAATTMAVLMRGCYGHTQKETR